MRIFLCLLLLASTVQAETTTRSMTPDKGLPPDKLQAIRQIGQNILQSQEDARESGGNETAATNASLKQLSTTINNLIAAETPAPSLSSHPIVINASGNAAATSGTKQATGKKLMARMSSQSQAWAEVSTLRQNAGHLQKRKNTPAEIQVYSGGFPVGEQHGRLYDNLADKLENILSIDSPNRLAQLKALRAQLTPKNTGSIRTPIAQRTPSIQVMTWENPDAHPR